MTTQRSVCSILAAAGLLWTLLAPAVQAQDESSAELKKLFEEMEAARAKIERYCVTCTITSDEIDSYPTGLKITYQFSKPDQHRLIIYDYSECANENRGRAIWLGRSGEFYISGVQGRDSFLAPWKDGLDPFRAKPHFDVMALGFGFLGDLEQGSSLGRLTENLSRFSEPLGVNLAGDDALVLINSSKSPRPRFLIDKQRGYWPIKSDLTHGSWKLRLQQIGDIYVPGWFEFTSLDGRKEPNGKLTVELDWQSLNEKFAVGRDAAASIAKDYGSNFIDGLNVKRSRSP